jgi:dolichol-phosphate mannosyltransferase
MKSKVITIVVPVYNEEKNIGFFLSKLRSFLPDKYCEYEVIFCLDPSRDNSEKVVREARSKDKRIKLIVFSRRVGQPMAILAGLRMSSGDAVIVMDVDMQDPPELSPQMIQKWTEGYDVVIPQRQSRSGEPWIKKLVSYVGYRVINKISDFEIPRNTGDFRLLSRKVVNHLVALKENHGFLRGMVALVGFRQCLIPFDRPPRHAGKTNYNQFLGSLKIGFNGIFCFSTYALTLASTIGFLVAGASLFIGLAYAVLKVCGFPFPLGNPTIVILLLLLGGIQLIGVGILGEYIARIYDEVRERPKYIIDQAYGFKKNKPKKEN